MGQTSGEEKHKLPQKQFAILTAICYCPILQTENTARLQNKNMNEIIHGVTVKQGDLYA